MALSRSVFSLIICSTALRMGKGIQAAATFCGRLSARPLLLRDQTKALCQVASAVMTLDKIVPEETGEFTNRRRVKTTRL